MSEQKLIIRYNGIDIIPTSITTVNDVQIYEIVTSPYMDEIQALKVKIDELTVKINLLLNK